MATTPEFQQQQTPAAEAPRRGGRRKKAAAATGDPPAATAARKTKTRQRGMGVAQLERVIRLQNDHQRLKKMGVITSPASSAAVYGQVLPAPANNSFIGYPLQFSNPKIGAFGYGEILSSSSASHHDVYGFSGSNNSLFNVGNVTEKQSHCDCCHEKKRMASEGNSSYNQWVNIMGQNQDYFSTDLIAKQQFLHVGYANKGVVKVQKKGSSSSASKGVIEYEFFPEKSNSNQSYSQDDMVMMMSSMMTTTTPTTTPSESSRSSPVLAAMATSAEASFDASIDLSLRLSY